MKRLKIFAWVGLVLGVAQILLMLTSWLLTAAMPDVFVRSLLSAEGIRWFLGQFQSNMASPLLVWLVLCSIAHGAYRRSGISRYNHHEYRQRFAMGVACFGFVLLLLIMLALTLLPHAILLNVMGGLFPSSFTQCIIPYCAFVCTVVCCSFGVMSGKMKGVVGIFEALTSGIAWGAPSFVLYILAAQLYYSLSFLL